MKIWEIILRMLDHVKQEYQCSERKFSDDSCGRLKHKMCRVKNVKVGEPRSREIGVPHDGYYGCGLGLAFSTLGGCPTM